MGSLKLGLRHVPNWWQLGRFLAVGASGFVINIVLYGALVHGAGADYRLAAVISNGVALSSNFAWNRLWTFRATHGRTLEQAPRFFLVNLAGFAANLLVLQIAVETVDMRKLPSEIVASAIAAPINFLGSRQWAFRRRRAST